MQWLAAAVTVGLGFGLKEIFENFVSGLIVLTEQPVRVGDTVTVGEVTGTVSRIRMRAVYITDFDRKELVVPNREFVTGRVINWTLSDSVLRLRLPIGIGYGADTHLAERLLLGIARNNASVLREPAPAALFLGFGDSTLNFELRVFLGNQDLVPTVRHDLLNAIHEAFRANNIEIAFPQRDLHLRSVAEPVTRSMALLGRGTADHERGAAAAHLASNAKLASDRRAAARVADSDQTAPGKS